MEVGDRVMLFLHFPFDFVAQRPLHLGSVSLVDTPQMRLAAHIPTASFLLPGYGLPIGLVQCCLLSRPPFVEQIDSSFFSFLSALRVWQPFPIEIGGAFTIGAGDGELYFTGQLNSYTTRTIGGRNTQPYFGDLDLQNAAELRTITSELEHQRHKKILAARMCFSQVTLGSVRAFQPAVVTLFASLEALFTNGNAQPVELAQRVAQFLSGKPLGVDVEAWLLEAYTRLRGPFAHGRYELTPEAVLRPEHEADFHLLHEVVRLSLLGVLTKPREWQTQFCALTGAALRQLDNVAPADSELFAQSQPCF